ncbi:MAG: hypothetical protein K1060chlam5_00898 [Candidatus Anoxychlamydiales bacterium]|nr:hypothetical protein [Candidatus Anoxychlamydiales bacterium]
MKNLKKLLLIAILTSSFAFANEEDERAKSNEVSKEDTKLFQKARKEEMEVVFNETKEKKYNPSNLPPLVFSHPLHQLFEVKADGSAIVIEDESVWRIRNGYQKEVLKWTMSDPIILVQNDSYVSSWIYGYNYKMINKNTNTAVEVKLHLLPKLNNPYILFVSYIDPIRKEVGLSDGTFWKIDSSQFYLINKWELNDSVVVGSNLYKRWYSNQECILINVAIRSDVRADQVE